MPRVQALPPVRARASRGPRDAALVATGVVALVAGGTVFLADRFQPAFIVILVIAWGFGLHRAVRVVQAWRAEDTGTRAVVPAPGAPPWRGAALVSALMIGNELTVVGAAVLLQTTTNENWFKLLVLGLIAVPASCLVGPMLLVQQRWSPGRPLLRAESVALAGASGAVRRAVLATRALAAVSWVLALLITAAVIGLLVVIVQTR